MGSWISELISVILSILILISIGFFGKRTGLLKKEDNAVLNNIIIYLTMPALIFRAVFESDISLSLLKIPLLALIVVTLSMGVAFVAGRFARLSRPTFGALIIAASLGNTGYLGFPLTLQIFGIENLVRAVFYDLFGTAIFMFTVGLFIADKYGEGRDRINKVKEILTFPPLLGLVAALALKGFGLPEFMTDAIGFLAGATVPLIMLSIGLSLEVADMGRYKLEIGITGLIKLALAPLIALFGASAFSMTQVDMGITILEASMPTAMFSMIIGLKYGLDTDFLPAAIVATTMISLVTIPIWQYALRLLIG
ncbi:MAG: AEC family transporter [Actinobacteria bacterium]|nr:AEC family transporter [Actinomycetota bacterium]